MERGLDKKQSLTGLKKQGHWKRANIAMSVESILLQVTESKLSLIKIFTSLSKSVGE